MVVCNDFYMIILSGRLPLRVIETGRARDSDDKLGLGVADGVGRDSDGCSKNTRYAISFILSGGKM